MTPMRRTTPPTTWDNLPLVLSATEAAQIMRCDVRIVRALAHTPGFPALPVGRAIRISRDGLRRWLERGGAAAANERDALAAIGGRSQAAAAASMDSIARPAVQ